MRKLTLIVAAVIVLASSAFAAPLCTNNATLATWIADGTCSVGIFDITLGAYTQSQTGALAASAITVSVNTSTAGAVSLSYNATNANPFRAGGTLTSPVVYSLNYTISSSLPGFAFLNQNDSLIKMAGATGTFNFNMSLGADGKTSLLTCSGCTTTGTISGIGRSYTNLPSILTVTNSLNLTATGAGSKVFVNGLTDRFGYKVPEPGTIGFLASGLLGLGILARRRRA